MFRLRPLLALAVVLPTLVAAQADNLNRFVTERASERMITIDSIPDSCILKLYDTPIAFGFGIHLRRVVPGQSFTIVVPQMPNLQPSVITHASVDVKGNWPIGLWTQPAQFKTTFSDGEHSGVATAIGESYLDGARPKTLPEKVNVMTDLWGNGGLTGSYDRYFGGGSFAITVEIPTLGSDNFGSQVTQVTDVRFYFVFGTGASQVTQMGAQLYRLGLFALLTGI